MIIIIITIAVLLHVGGQPARLVLLLGLLLAVRLGLASSSTIISIIGDRQTLSISLSLSFQETGVWRISLRTHESLSNVVSGRERLSRI